VIKRKYLLVNCSLSILKTLKILLREHQCG